jgi:shingomyelin synthase
MVLDAKSGGSHNDYGSIGLSGKSGGTEGSEGTNGGGGGSGGEMSQSDLYQRQPLLPQPVKNGGAVSVNIGQATTDFFQDDDEEEDEKSDSLKRNVISPNGEIKIDMPGPHRDESRFPKEKWKTFVGRYLAHLSFHVFLIVELIVICLEELIETL